MPIGKVWYVYLLLCRDDSLYCGITNRLKRRIKAHNDGKGAKYTRGRGPVTLVYVEKMKSKGMALRREARIKAMPRSEKVELFQRSEA
jgi:putative endonuclease